MTLEVQPVKNSLIEDPVIITGLTRSGKWMLSTIVSSFDRAEHVSVDSLMEQVVMMYTLGVIREDAARSLLRYAIDSKGYNIFLGRDVNIRPGDYTGIWGSGKVSLFLKRLFSKEGEVVLKKIREDKPIFIFLVHDALWHFDLYRDAFPGIRMIHIDRHPVDLVYSWHSKGYGADFTHNYSTGTVMIKAGDKQLLYYTAGREKEYGQMREADRVIHMVKELTDKHDKKYQSLTYTEKEKVRKITFEKFVTNPDPILKELALFLSTRQSRFTLRVCRKQRCPRKINKEDREKKIIRLKGFCSNESFRILMDMANDYEVRNGLK